MVRMTGSTPLHVESRPSMLSSHRIALQQHSGARPRPALRSWGGRRTIDSLHPGAVHSAIDRCSRGAWISNPVHSGCEAWLHLASVMYPAFCPCRRVARHAARHAVLVPQAPRRAQACST